MYFWIKTENFLEFLRNLTPQVVICASAVSIYLSATRSGWTWQDIFIVLCLGSVFIFAAVANSVQLLVRMRENINESHKDKKRSIAMVLPAVVAVTALIEIGLGIVIYTAMHNAARCT